MIEEKRSIIESEGVPVEIIDVAGTILSSTKAIIGRASRQNSQDLALEHYRNAVFLPDAGVVNGTYLRSTVTGEHYLVRVSYPEVIDGVVCSTIARMVVCNNVIDVEGVTKTADAKGNITKTVTTKVSGLNVYVEAVTAELKQYDPGLYPKVEYRIYAPAFAVEELDRVLLTISGVKVPFKVETLDFISMDGIVIIGICSETRK